MKALTRRLLALEARAGLQRQSAVERMSNDEIEIRLLDISRKLLALGGDGSEKLAARVAETEKRIVATAHKQASPEYAQHLSWLKELWAQREPGIEYVCDLFDKGWGYDDWEKPNIMGRRKALRERSDIAALIALKREE